MVQPFLFNVVEVLLHYSSYKQMYPIQPLSFFFLSYTDATNC